MKPIDNQISVFINTRFRGGKIVARNGQSQVQASTRTRLYAFLLCVPFSVLLVPFGWRQSGSAVALAEAASNPQPLRPDRTLTPGVTNPAITQENILTTICVHGYTAKERDGELETNPVMKAVTQGEKEKVYAAYKIFRRAPKQYEIDHLISLELGGANAIGNLWPQSYITKPWNAHVKDRLENELNKRLCAQKITLADAQACIADDWIACFQKTFGVETP